MLLLDVVQLLRSVFQIESKPRLEVDVSRISEFPSVQGDIIKLTVHILGNRLWTEVCTARCMLTVAL